MIELHENEKVRMIVRKHWFVMATRLFFLFIVALLPLFFFLIIRFIIENTSEVMAGDLERTFSFGGPLIVFLSLLWLFFLWIWGFVLWTDYYLDVWIVTNKRVFDIEQNGFFQREISVFRMDRVQDITTDVKGIIPTFFNFGDINVQTAGGGREFIMRGAPAPTSLKEVISSLQDKRQNPLDYSNEEGL